MKCIDIGRVVTLLLNPPPVGSSDPTGPTTSAPVPKPGVYEISVDGDALISEGGTDPTTSGMLINAFTPRRIRVVNALAGCALGGSSIVRITLAPVEE